ncbi:MAG TPA: hypothetical protein PKE05_10270 [Microthrixaceae bacterium]|nr:hypothetical protein [Microthrixaceae bacterium]
MRADRQGTRLAHLGRATCDIAVSLVVFGVDLFAKGLGILS